MLTFADAEVIKMARDRFVPVAADDWYQRRRKDAEGAFFRKVSDQGPRKASGENGTRQGIYVFTAGGRLLAFRNHSDPAVMRQVLRQSLAAWDRLPENERRPGAVRVEASAKLDERYLRRPPKGTTIVDVFTRILERDGKDGYRHGTCEFVGGDRAAHDRLWILPDEIRGLAAGDLKVGAVLPIPERLLYRIARFHLVDDTRGEPPHWERREVHRAELRATVTKATRDSVELTLEGNFLLAAGADPKTSKRGYEASLLGYVAIDRRKNVPTRFDLVVLGEHWGEGPFTRQARPGRSPLGIAFSLSPGDTPSDAVPPQAARSLPVYLRPER